MWSLLICVRQQEPRDYVIKSGRHSVGRKGDNDITIADPFCVSISFRISP